jgi:hypothetical protein
MNRHIMPLIVAALLSACGFVPDPTPDPLPTEDEAIAFMRDLVTSRRLATWWGCASWPAACVNRSSTRAVALLRSRTSHRSWPGHG